MSQNNSPPYDKENDAPDEYMVGDYGIYAADDTDSERTVPNVNVTPYRPQAVVPPLSNTVPDADMDDLNTHYDLNQPDEDPFNPPRPLEESEMEAEVDAVKEIKEPDAAAPADPNEKPFVVITQELTEEDYKHEGMLYLDIDNFSEFARGIPEVQQRLSKPVYVRGLPWRILAIPREGTRCTATAKPLRALGYFLQCNGDSDMINWNCVANAALYVLTQKEGVEDHCRRISHTFYPKENDWGYSQFLGCDVLLNPEMGYIADDTIKLRVKVCADAPHGVHWDSKKHSGYVGLKNQGATCYMNSILQTFYFTNRLRRAIYDIPTQNEENEHNIALALQRTFYELQHSNEAVGTKKLTKSFGWDSIETFMQHDVQELCRVLMENMENKMKNTDVADTIPHLFRGVMKSYIKCLDVDFESGCSEPFYDIQLNVKGKTDVMHSFREYTEVEILDGDNKYDAGSLGLQRAQKGVKFTVLPPVLHLQLMRFTYDVNIDSNVKINDRFEFSEHLDLSNFVESNNPERDATYILHAVLVHSGDFHGGHYVVYIHTNLLQRDEEPKWCKFDDEVVSTSSIEDAIQHNFGGEELESIGRTFTNAYMLVYVKVSCLEDTLLPIPDESIPLYLQERFEIEREEEMAKRKEKMEAHLYTEVLIVMIQDLMAYHGFDLIDNKHFTLEDSFPREKVEKAMTLEALYEYVNKKLFNQEMTEDAPLPIRIWKFEETQFREHTTPMGSLPRSRPSYMVPMDKEKTVADVFDLERNLIFIETGFQGNFESEFQGLMPYDDSSDMLCILKYYNATHHRLDVIGNIIISYRSTFDSYMDFFRKATGGSSDTPIRVYEETAPETVREVNLRDKSSVPIHTENVLSEVNDGAILILERGDTFSAESNLLSHVDKMFNTIEVECFSNHEAFIGHKGAVEPFTAIISLNWNMRQMAEFIGLSINHPPEMILLWRMQAYNEKTLTYIYGSQWQLQQFRVKDMLGLTGTNNHDPRKQKKYKVVYTKMPIRVAELDQRKQMKVLFMDEKMNISEVSIFPDKNGNVRNMLEEAAREFPFSANGTRRLRLLYVGLGPTHTRILCTLRPDDSVAVISQKISQPNLYAVRVEEIPPDQINIAADEYLLPVAHFEKDPSRMHGIPFYIKVAHDEPHQYVRERIRVAMDIQEKDIEKFRFAIIHQVHNQRLINRYLDFESTTYVINLSDFGLTQHGTVWTTSKYGDPGTSPFLGIDRVNRHRATRPAQPAEKAIIIHN